MGHPVWYHPDFIANILTLVLIKDQFRVLMTVKMVVYLGYIFLENLVYTSHATVMDYIFMNAVQKVFLLWKL